MLLTSEYQRSRDGCHLFSIGGIRSQYFNFADVLGTYLSSLLISCVQPAACLGVVREGCEADLLLLTKDPRADIRNTETIEDIIAKGRWFTPAELVARERAMLQK